MLRQKYVLGFMFSKDYKQVALIEKNKPEWQSGLLNGIGGKVENGESSIGAMVREFEEEAFLKTVENDWRKFLALDGEDWIVDCFLSTGDLSTLKSMTSEEIYIKDVGKINPFQLGVVENLIWIIPLAIDCLQDKRPSSTKAIYD